DLPPLRRRGRDVLLLAAHFAGAAGAAPHPGPIRIDEAAAESLLRYGWPGNVRELQLVMARAVLLSSGDVVTAADVAMLDPRARHASEPFVLPAGGVNLDDLERRLVVEALA